MPIRGKYQPVTDLVDARIAAGYQSREDAAIRVPYAAVTIGRHERGEIRLAPDDIIIYAKAYNAPEIICVRSQRRRTGLPILRMITLWMQANAATLMKSLR